jgi:NAD(P)-dependent dehydrogenase (short-subunit alcohol dehydrogenase family)
MTERVSALRLTGDELLVLHDGTAARLLELEERYGTQVAALDAHPELARTAATVQRIRAKIAAHRLGVELQLDAGALPFPADVLADCQRVFQRIVDRPGDVDAVGDAAGAAGLP